MASSTSDVTKNKSFMSPTASATISAGKQVRKYDEYIGNVDYNSIWFNLIRTPLLFSKTLDADYKYKCHLTLVYLFTCDFADIFIFIHLFRRNIIHSDIFDAKVVIICESVLAGFWKQTAHYCDVIMGAVASQITGLTIVYSTVYSDADQRKHQSSASLAFVWGIHRGPVNSPHKTNGQ